MSNITPTLTRPSEATSRDIWLATWETMGNADTGLPVSMAGSSDRSVQMTGSFGGATVVLEGSNDGSNWYTLNDPTGTPISRTSGGLKQIVELTRYVRARSSGGTGTDVDVTLLLKGNIT
jgi:hypothetical protein